MTHPTGTDHAPHTAQAFEEDPGDPVLDEDWLAAPTARSRFRVVMVGAIVAGLCFLGGAVVQKHWGTDDTAAAAGPPGGAGGLPAGGFSGGFPGSGSGAPAAQGQAAPGGADASSSPSVDANDSVIGSVVRKKGDVWVIEDLGGKRHQVTVGDAVTITRESRIDADQVATGDRVQITGTHDGDRLDATDITLR